MISKFGFRNCKVHRYTSIITISIFSCEETIFEVESPFLFGCNLGAVGMEIMDVLEGLDESRPIL